MEKDGSKSREDLDPILCVRVVEACCYSISFGMERNEIYLY